MQTRQRPAGTNMCRLVEQKMNAHPPEKQNSASHYKSQDRLHHARSTTHPHSDALACGYRASRPSAVPTARTPSAQALARSRLGVARREAGTATTSRPRLRRLLDPPPVTMQRQAQRISVTGSANVQQRKSRTASTSTWVSACPRSSRNTLHLASVYGFKARTESLVTIETCMLLTRICD